MKTKTLLPFACFTVTLLTASLLVTPARAGVFDLETKLIASDAARDDYFGQSVAISGNTALVGAQNDDDGSFYSGSAYLFDVTTGSQIAKLTASDAAAYDEFGYSVAISGNTALVGAHYDDDAGINSGSAYLFKNIPEPSSFLLATLAGLFTLGNAPCRTRK